jgi:predicted hydrolase (HD superfamily)
MNNPPAFPSSVDDGETVKYMLGMSMRDYFAARAMQGLIHHFDFGTFRDDPERLALWAYDAADEMLKAREA